MTATASAATAGHWSAATAADPFALPEQSRAWVDAVCRHTSARDASRAYRSPDGSTWVLPMVRTRTGSLWSPPPAWGVGGLLGPELDAGVVRTVLADLRSQRSARIGVRIDTRHEGVWSEAADDSVVRIRRRCHVIDLHPTVEQHRAALSKSTRRTLRRAAEHDVRVEVDHTGRLIDTHYQLYLLSVRRWAQKQHEPLRLAMFRARRRDPIEKLRAMHEALGERCMVVVSYVDDQPAASAIVLLGETTRDTRGAMDVELAGPTCAGHATQWRAIEEAYAYGARRYHLGESGDAAGLAQFKERFGATPIEHHEYRIERLPVTRTADLARRAVKSTIGFKDT